MKFFIEVLYDLMGILFTLTISYLLALNCFFYQTYFNLQNNAASLLLGFLLCIVIIFLLYFFWKQKKIFMTLKNRYSYLFLYILQIIFYVNATSLMFNSHIYTRSGIAAIESILANVLVYFVLTTVVIVTKKRMQFPLRIFSKISSIHIIPLLIFALFLLMNGWGGNYIEIINTTIWLYYFFTLGINSDSTCNISDTVFKK